MEIATWVVAVILIGSFVASMINAAFATGGALLMLAINASVLPVNAIVPLHSTFLFGSLVARCVYFWRHMVWHIVVPFVLGCVIGCFVGAKLYLDIPEIYIATTIGVLILVSTWMPTLGWNVPIKHPFFLVGIVHSLLSTLFAFGAIMQALMIRTRLSKEQITATLAGGLLMMGVLKITGYWVFGFDYLPYALLIAGATVCGFLGTWVGKQISIKISETTFHRVFKGLMTILALRLLYRAWELL